MLFCRRTQRRQASRTPPANRRQPAMGAIRPLRSRGANHVSVTHATLHSGDPCPECRQGKVYPQKPATLVQFVGQAPLEATVFELERLRCNACGQIFTAEEPETAGPAKYDETAVAMIALLKYGTGVPFNGLERLQGQLGIPCRRHAVGTDGGRGETATAGAGGIDPAGGAGRRAAQRRHRHADSATGARAGRQADRHLHQRHRVAAGRWRIALYFTGSKHAGENIAEVLKQRARELPAPIQMCDALSRNTPKLAGVEPLHGQLPGPRKAAVCGSSRRTFPKNAGTCWRRWAPFITTMRRRGNRSCRRKTGCTSIRSTAGR